MVFQSNESPRQLLINKRCTNIHIHTHSPNNFNWYRGENQHWIEDEIFSRVPLHHFHTRVSCKPHNNALARNDGENCCPLDLHYKVIKINQSYCRFSKCPICGYLVPISISSL